VGVSERLLVIGDALLDRDVRGSAQRLAPDAPVPVVDEEVSIVRPGGAGLAAALAARDGHEVTLVTGVGQDAAGRELLSALARAGVAVVDVGLDGQTPEKVRVMADGRVMLRLDRGGRDGRPGPPPAHLGRLVQRAGAVLVSDYGRGLAARDDIRAAARRADALVWDPHPRGPAPPAGTLLVTPNDAEAQRLVPELAGVDVGAAIRRAEELARRWEARHVCITRGERGAVLAGPSGPPLAIPAPPAHATDPCGAGDRFAAAAVIAIAAGAAVQEAVPVAVDAASAFVAAGGAARAFGPAAEAGRSSDEAQSVLSRVRHRGGTVVATGGCFDLLHPGHIRTLEAARALGDCLIVCMNSDESVRRLKGPRRPLVPEQDRAAVLRALGCVDAVVVFGEDTPEQVLARLRPDVWAKGGDYVGSRLPEADVLERWGGSAVVLPYVEGRSTTRLIAEAAGT
jgi:D-beta-D-heptose 7-phosphate kinase / D-beta-D-heptose 1-phosphate adenosyltransferase